MVLSSVSNWHGNGIMDDDVGGGVIGAAWCCRGIGAGHLAATSDLVQHCRGVAYSGLVDVFGGVV